MKMTKEQMLKDCVHDLYHEMGRDKQMLDATLRGEAPPAFDQQAALKILMKATLTSAHGLHTHGLFSGHNKADAKQPEHHHKPGPKGR